MKILFTIILIAFSTSSFAQTVTIKGKIISPLDSFNLAYANVYSNNKIGTICDTTGNFLLTLDRQFFKDTLNISYIGFRLLKILNLPNDVDTIDLGNIPLFYGKQGILMNDFFCRWINFRCRHKVNVLWKKVEKENKEYISKINKSVENYRFRFNHNLYKLKYNNNNNNNLTIILDLSKPEKK